MFCGATAPILLQKNERERKEYKHAVSCFMAPILPLTCTIHNIPHYCLAFLFDKRGNCLTHTTVITPGYSKDFIDAFSK